MPRAEKRVIEYFVLPPSLPPSLTPWLPHSLLYIFSSLLPPPSLSPSHPPSLPHSLLPPFIAHSLFYSFHFSSLPPSPLYCSLSTQILQSILDLLHAAGKTERSELNVYAYAVHDSCSEQFYGGVRKHFAHGQTVYTRPSPFFWEGPGYEATITSEMFSIVGEWERTHWHGLSVMMV